MSIQTDDKFELLWKQIKRKTRNNNKTARRLGRKERLRIAQKRRQLIRLDYKCAYCGVDLKPTSQEPDSMTIDHIKPFARGGKNSNRNTTLCCYKCNQDKWSKDCRKWLKAKYGREGIIIWLYATSKIQLRDAIIMTAQRVDKSTRWATVQLIFKHWIR